MSIPSTPVLGPSAIGEEFRADAKGYGPKTALDGVRVLRLGRHVDDRGFLQEIYRAKADQPESVALADFFRDVPVAQINFTVVDVPNHVKGLHYHLRQQDVWYCPHPSKAKFVLLDVRRESSTFGMTQVIVAGDGQDLLVRIPEGVAHGYRPLTTPCTLLYIVTRTFDARDPDEYRIAWDHPSVRDLWDVQNG